MWQITSGATERELTWSSDGEKLSHSAKAAVVYQVCWLNSEQNESHLPEKK
jgi:hypothetical protein